MKHPLIIGAGGVASYLLPVLIKTFKPEELTIVDKDTLEQRNLDRQMFREAYIGRNKAQALINTVAPEIRTNIIEEWFTDSTVIPENVDAIFCCADNHMARMCAMNRATLLHRYAYIGGNEYLDSQAFVYHPDWKGTPKDPLRRYPNIAWDETGSPTACTGETQQASPQLAIANLNCAAKLLHLAWVYERWVRENTKMLQPTDKETVMKNLPCEFFSTLTTNEVVA